MSCGIGSRCSLDAELLWWWHRPAAVELIQPLAWEPPNAMGATLETKKKKVFNAVEWASSSYFISKGALHQKEALVIQRNETDPRKMAPKTKMVV